MEDSDDDFKFVESSIKCSSEEMLLSLTQCVEDLKGKMNVEEVSDADKQLAESQVGTISTLKN